ncbi:MAG: M48 family metallopeptidase [Pseudomonadota bacterium]
MRNALLLLAALVLTSCSTSPLGRNQLILFPESEMNQMGVAAYQDIKNKTPARASGSTDRYVQCVSEHVVRALPGGNPEDWEVTVFDEDQANAFALPGGKIGVYTGLLKVAEDQDQLATVIGHEVAHVLARHSNERVSTATLTQSGLQLAQIAAGATSPMKQQLFGLLGLGAQVGVILPFGRKQESEADLVGLDLMANAGFDPRASVKLWQNMAAASGGKSQPEFMSTHPSSDRRIAQLNERIPSAMKLSLAARQSGKTPDCS